MKHTHRVQEIQWFWKFIILSSLCRSTLCVFHASLLVCIRQHFYKMCTVQRHTRNASKIRISNYKIIQNCNNTSNIHLILLNQHTFSTCSFAFNLCTTSRQITTIYWFHFNSLLFCWKKKEVVTLLCWKIAIFYYTFRGKIVYCDCIILYGVSVRARKRRQKAKQ